MLLTALLSLAADALPINAEPIGNAANWVVASDFPPSEWAHASLTSYDLTLDENGTPLGCVITHPSGSDVIDAIVCSSLMRRARYRPAKDESGASVPSVIRDHVQWHPQASGENQYLRDAPDVIVANPAAKSTTRPEIVKVVELISAAGNVEMCALAKPSKTQALNEIACSIATRPDVSTPAKDGSGRPIRALRAFTIGFVTGSDNRIYVR